MIPKLVAHRGYMENYPENSLLALEMALKAGACMIEFDVQMSADHELMVLHDSNFQRTAGRFESIFDLTLPELAAISVHEPARLGEQFLTTPIPMLTEVMELIGAYPAATAFVEIKDQSLMHWGLEVVMETLQSVLEPYASQSVIIAYNADALQCVKQRGLYSTGWVLNVFDETHHQKARQLQPQYLICNYTKISHNIELWQGEWLWMLYEINNPELALKWATRGADLIETSDIGSMLQYTELSKGSCQHGS